MSDTWGVVRIGVVAAIDYARARVRVHFDAIEDTSDWLPVLQPSVNGAKFYAMPEMTEPVVCVFNSDGHEEGFVLGAFYRMDSPPPGAGAGIVKVEFADGSYSIWNNGALSIKAVGGVAVQGDTEITGDLEVTGDLQVNGAIHATGIVYASDFVKT